MNCHDALIQLEAARPSSSDYQEPDLVTAFTHVESCRGCRETLDAREQLDRRIGRVMRDVPVPAGLKERLLASLWQPDATNGSDQPEPDVTAAKPFMRPVGDAANAASARVAVQGRRRWLQAVIGVAAAAALITGVFVLWTQQPEPSNLLTMDDVRRQTTLDLSRLEAFNGQFHAPPPDGLWQHSRRIQFDETAKGDLPGVDGKHRAALYKFTYRNDRGEFHGVMLVMPKRFLNDPPTATMINTERRDLYARRESGSYHTFAWQPADSELVYVCFVPAGGEAVDALQQVLSPQPA